MGDGDKPVGERLDQLEQQVGDLTIRTATIDSRDTLRSIVESDELQQRVHDLTDSHVISRVRRAHTLVVVGVAIIGFVGGLLLDWTLSLAERESKVEALAERTDHERRLTDAIDNAIADFESRFAGARARADESADFASEARGRSIEAQNAAEEARKTAARHLENARALVAQAIEADALIQRLREAQVNVVAAVKDDPQFIDSVRSELIRDILPVGTVAAWPGPTPPEESGWGDYWAPCDGRRVPFSDALWTAVGGLYENDVKAETIRLPDFQGYFLRGHGEIDRAHRSGPLGVPQLDSTRIDEGLTGNRWKPHHLKNSDTILAGNATRHEAIVRMDEAGSWESETRPINMPVLWMIKIR